MLGWAKTFHIAAVLSLLPPVCATALEKKGVSPRDVFPSTASDVSDAVRENIYRPVLPPPPDRLYEIGIGFGVPYLAMAELGLQVLKKWQVGFSYGLLPQSGLIPNVNMPPILQSVGGLTTVQLDPVMTTTLQVMSPFVRYFPTERLFYFQLTWGMLFSNHTITSGVYDHLTAMTIPGATVQADIQLITTIPTISIGYFFWRHVYFFNVAIGGTFLLSSTSTVAMTASLPAWVGNITAAQQDQLQNSLDQGLANSIAQFRNQIGVLPSVMLTTGVMF